MCSQDRYGDGLVLAPEGQTIRAVLYANRAACHLELQSFKEAAKDCSSAIDIDGSYLKAWHRRAKAYEGLDDVDHALRDFQKVSFKASKMMSQHLCNHPCSAACHYCVLQLASNVHG